MKVNVSERPSPHTSLSREPNFPLKVDGKKNHFCPWESMISSDDGVESEEIVEKVLRMAHYYRVIQPNGNM